MKKRIRFTCIILMLALVLQLLPLNLFGVFVQRALAAEVERKFVFHGSRNMLDEFTGKIIGIYPAIFTILDSNGTLKSFSYSDLLIGNLEIL